MSTNTADARIVMLTASGCLACTTAWGVCLQCSLADAAATTGIWAVLATHLQAKLLAWV
jgi:hypothetical protein